MIDLHCHLLPGIDDGPSSLGESLELCRIAVEEGTTHAIATPHIHPGRWENTAQTIHQSIHVLRQALDEHDVPLQLGFAGEVRLSDQVMRQVLDSEIPFYGVLDGYQIMLLEFPHGYIVPGTDKLVKWLLAQGVRPLIAHPERNKQIMKDISALQSLIQGGCWLQLTAGSITGHFGPGAQAVARHLLEQDAVAVVASDAHNTGARAPRLRQAFEKITQHYGEQRARRLLLEAPAAIVADQFPQSPQFTTMASAV